MNLQAFYDADPVIKIHMIAASLALVIGGYVLFRRKGTWLHVRLGYVWVILMLFVAFTGFFIHEIRTWGLFSPIHLFSVFVPLSLGHAIYMARQKNIKAHKQIIVANYIGGNLIAGGFTFLPGRTNFDIFFSTINLPNIPLEYGVALSLGAGLAVAATTYFISLRTNTR